MEPLKISSLILLSSFVLSCTGDIKGEKGDTGTPGQDATSAALISLKRPAFRSSTGSANKVVVPATVSKPAKVLIKGSVYTNTSDTTLDPSTAGPGGLDAPGGPAASTIYYLYAIPAGTGSTFNLVASANDPDTGPTAYTDWSYLGSFYTLADSSLPAFIYARGRLVANQQLETKTHPLSDATPGGIAYTLKVPLHALSVIGFAEREAQQRGTTFWSGTTSGFASVINLDALAGQGAQQIYRAEIPLYDGPKIYISNENQAAGTYNAYWVTVGWTEDPTDWN